MNYIILDFEATCEDRTLDPHRTFKNEIIEFAAIKLDSELKEVDSFCEFVKPIINTKLTPFCTKLTTIKDSDLEQANSFPEVVSNFKSWLGKEPYIILAWGLYDKGQYIKDLELHGVTNKYRSLFNLYESLKHLHHTHILNGKNRPVGMGKALKMANLSLDGTHHRGIDDTRNIAKILRHHKDILIPALSKVKR